MFKIKKLLIIIIILLVVLGGGAFGYFSMAHKSSKKSVPKIKVNGKTVVLAKWNPYSFANNYEKTLPDFLISADRGLHDIKMTVTLRFGNQDAVDQFLGLSTPTSILTTAEQGAIAPMQTKISYIVNNTMLAQNTQTLGNLNAVRQVLKNAINSQIGLGKNFVTNVYIDNYLIQ